jgi:hypothetical protein
VGRREICAELTLLPRGLWLSYLGSLTTTKAEMAAGLVGLVHRGLFTGRW